jgi:hypothetical protein
VREVISDTSTLQYLHQADSLDLLRRLYGTILVPEGVAEEIAEGRRLGHSLPDLGAIGWIRVTPVTDPRVLLMVADLGKGEREVLSLATEKSGALALLDDTQARRMARHLGIPFTGTLGVLLRAKAAGHLDAVAPIVARLQSFGFWLDEATRVGILELAGEVDT